MTALVDIANDSVTNRARSRAEYLRLAVSTLSIGVPMVVFTEPDLVPALEALRRQHAPGVPSVVVAYVSHPERDHDLACVTEWLDRVRPLCSSDARKDTPEYLTFMWSKVDCLRRAASMLEGSWYWWIDIGVAHTSQVPDELAHRLFELSDLDDTSSSGLRTSRPVDAYFVSLERDDWHSVSSNWTGTWFGAAASAEWWWLQGAQLVAGGLFGVGAKSLDTLAGWFREAVGDAAAHGAAVTDEMLLSRILACHPFDIVTLPARYDDLFAGVTRPRLRLGDLCPSVRFLPLPGLDRSDRSAFNPSIAASPDGGFRVIVRQANYRYDAGVYRPLDGSDVIVTENVMMQLDDDLHVDWSVPIDDSLARVEPALFSVVGLEDMRLFRHDGRWWASATSREHRSDGLCEIVVVGFGEGDDAARVTTSFRVPALRAHRHEKNWAPVIAEAVEPDAPMSFLWSIEPTCRIVIDDTLGRVAFDTSLPILADGDAVRGGSQVVAVSGGWLSVVHRAVADGARRVYEHRFVWWDADFRVRARSPWFVFEVEGIEFCAGLAATLEGVVLSFGFEDREAWLAELSWDDLRHVMEPGVDPPGPDRPEDREG